MKSLIQGFLTGTRGRARALAPRQVIFPRFWRHLNTLREISPLWGRIPCLSVQVLPRTHFRISSVKKPFAVARTLQGSALVFRDIHIVTGIACLWVKDAAGRHSLQHTDFHRPEVPQSWAPKCGLPAAGHVTYARMRYDRMHGAGRQVFGDDAARGWRGRPAGRCPAGH